MYKAPHSRHKVSKYYRENKNLVKHHQEKFKDIYSPNIKTKRRPKREVISGFKMSYRYKYYQQNEKNEEDEEKLE